MERLAVAFEIIGVVMTWYGDANKDGKVDAGEVADLLNQIGEKLAARFRVSGSGTGN